VIPATGHTSVAIPAIAPTCTIAGSTVGYACSVCSEVILAPTVIPATGHSPVAIPEQAPTATEQGSTGGLRCSVCLTILQAPQILPATGEGTTPNPPVQTPTNLWDGSIDTDFDGGDGSEASPYLIHSGAQLAYLTSLIASAEENPAYADKHYRLTANIDLNGYEWAPIGTEELPFCGTFDGNGYTVSNFRITTPTACIGLFGYLSDGMIQNLRVSDFHIQITHTATVHAGGLVGYAHSSQILACTADGTIHTEVTEEMLLHVGALIGYLNVGSIENCSASGAVSAASALDFAQVYVGGLIGNLTMDNCSIRDCTSDATTKASVTGSYGSAFVHPICGTYAE
jgi:hypothetical protein